MVYIERKITPAVLRAAEFYSVIVVTGPRQVGKTTMCRHIFADYNEYNLENIALRTAVESDPAGFIESCGRNVIIDEVQRLPELLSYIQLAVDNDPQRKFVLTGSSNFALLESITQSLAGRAALFTLLPFSLEELGQYKETSTNSLMVNGFYPGIVVKHTPVDLFYSNYYATYVERDLRQIKEITNLSSFQIFVKLLAGRVATEFNASSLATETGVSSPTIKSWFGLLQTSYIVFALTPYYANISKRLSKMPKVYFYDTGLLCFLLGINSEEQLAQHPLRGAIFENLVVCEFLKARFNQGKASNLYFYRENSGREVDVLIDNGMSYDLYEIKSSATFNNDFKRNLTYLKDLMGDKIRKAAVIYDGMSIPPDIFNFRAV